jgi:stage V sporulation protein R
MAHETYFFRAKRGLPQELAEAQQWIEGIARGHGLDFCETIFEMCDYDEINMIASYGGFPTRYPHWRFGMEYLNMDKGYEYGLQKIYEMVINTVPAYAYLLDNNTMMDQKLVMAHVYGHVDFFTNNGWFAHTNRRMLDQMANHSTRIRRHIDRQGTAHVETFIDMCLSLDNLIDPYQEHIRRETRRSESDIEKATLSDGVVKLPA